MGTYWYNSQKIEKSVFQDDTPLRNLWSTGRHHLAKLVATPKCKVTFCSWTASYEQDQKMPCAATKVVSNLPHRFYKIMSMGQSNIASGPE